MYQIAGFSSLLLPLFLRLHLKRFLHCILCVRLPNGRKLSLSGRRSFRIATLRSLSRAHSDMPVSRIICSFCLDFHFFKCLFSCFASPKRVLLFDFFSRNLFLFHLALLSPVSGVPSTTIIFMAAVAKVFACLRVASSASASLTLCLLDTSFSSWD